MAPDRAEPALEAGNEAGKTQKPVIGIYQPNFLSVSMTFIHRQLLGVSDQFCPIVLASRLQNQKLFPYPHVYVRRAGILERGYSRLARTVTGHIPAMSRSRQRFWKDLLLEWDARLIHAHFGPSGLEILPVARETGLPLIVTFHGSDASRALRNSEYVRKLRDLFAYATVITVSRRMADRLKALGANPARTLVHYIGAPIEDFCFVNRKPLRAKVEDGETITFLQVSNFVEKKGHVYTLEAFRSFTRHYSASKLVLAGGGRLEPEMRRLVSRWHLEDKVEFAGIVSKPQVIELMKNADVFLHHSVTARDGSEEGIPTVLMEAMATGLIVVSTFHSGIPELVENESSGYLVHERDVRAYTETLVRALKHSDGMPERARRSIEARFDLTRQNQVLKGIYSQIIDGSPKVAQA